MPAFPVLVQPSGLRFEADADSTVLALSLIHIWSLNEISIFSCGCCAARSRSTGATQWRPNTSGALTRKRPCGERRPLSSSASASYLSLIHILEAVCAAGRQLFSWKIAVIC